MLLKLPIGIQDFSELRQGNFVYVDKTELLYPLLTGSKTYFFARPRRFGKSLLISTLSYLFEGRRDLFKDLWIEKRWNWQEKHPVIRLSLDAISHKEYGLHLALIKELNRIAGQFGIELAETEPSGCFQELIRNLAAQQGQVVILIDEYDRPIIDYLAPQELPIAEANRAILKNFFSVLKSEDANIRFLFLTGVSKFSKVSIFSDLNHLQDLSMMSQSNNLCGYTQAEIQHYFKKILVEMPTDTLENMKKWYNGYSWNGRDFVYNPFSTLNFFSAREYDNFWFNTGTPTFLVKRLNRDFRYALDNLEVERQSLEAYELDKLQPIPLLFQTGYLTIKERTSYGTFILSYPNREVRESLVQSLLVDYTHADVIIPRVHHIIQSLNQGDLAKTVELLNGLFKTIPNPIFIANREAYYHSIIYLTFILLGVYVQAEVNSSDGRLDAIVFMPEKTFILEFKLHNTADEALQQIIEKDYAAPFRHLGKSIIAVGIQLSEEKKGIADWKSIEI